MRAHLIAECHKEGPGFQFSIRALTAAGSDFQTCIASLEDHLQSGIGQKVLAGPLMTRLLPTLAFVSFFLAAEFPPADYLFFA